MNIKENNDNSFTFNDSISNDKITFELKENQPLLTDELLRNPKDTIIQKYHIVDSHSKNDKYKTL